MAANILLIDDDVAFIHAATKLLSKRGYVVAGAANPGAAMNYLTDKQLSFDLVITDLSMPVLNGIKVLSTIRAARPQLPVILITAYGDATIRSEAMRLGAFDYLTKPVEPEQLVNAIERALEAGRTECRG